MGGGYGFSGQYPGRPAHRTLQPGAADSGHLVGLLRPCARGAKTHIADQTQQGGRHSTVGAVWQAPYELYAHCAVGRDAGLSDDAVHTLADGGLPKDLSDDETVAHRVARALSREHRLGEALYRQAEALLGPDGIMEIVVLTGFYHTVCAILNAFEIPAPS